MCQDDDELRGSRAATPPREELVAALGVEIARFQEATSCFDERAAQVFALEKADLPCMTQLLFGGPASVDRLRAALHVSRRALDATLERLQRAGYARRRPGRGGPVIEITDHARQWIERVWAPLRVEGERILAHYSIAELTLLSTFLVRARGMQEQQARRLERWLRSAPRPARQAHMRGGLSPAALRRVHVFVEAELERSIHVTDLADRAGLSIYHFSRAFRTATGTTPRAFVEQRRVERARALLADSAWSLADIAVACGFGSQSRLTTVFRRCVGATPGAYRRSVRPRTAARARPARCQET